MHTGVPASFPPQWSASGLIKLGPALDVAWKAGLFLTFALYTVGLIIATFNAEGFGLVNLELNRTIYILIGTQWAVQALFGFSLAHTLRTFWQKETTSGVTVKRVLAILTGTILTTVVFYGLFGFTAMSMRMGDPFTGPVALIFCVIAAMGWSLDFAIERTRHFIPARADSFAHFLILFFPLGRYAGFFLLSMVAYAGITYSLIPRAFGGGKMPVAEVFVKDDGQGLFGHLNVRVAKNHSIGRWSIVADLPNSILLTDARLMSGVLPRTFWFQKTDVEALSFITEPGPNMFSAFSSGSEPPPRSSPQTPRLPALKSRQ